MKCYNKDNGKTLRIVNPYVVLFVSWHICRLLGDVIKEIPLILYTPIDYKVRVETYHLNEN